MSQGGEPRIAIVHDELTRRGGAEGVLEELIRLYPAADIYALYAGRPQITVDGTTHQVKTTFLQKTPLWFRQHPKRLLPLLSYAAEQLDLSSYDLVISSSSGFAKAIVTRTNVPHVCYCHTPTRYLWDDTHVSANQSGRLQKLFGRPLLHLLRIADYAAAQRVDQFIANSDWTRQRINKHYRRDSRVICPPIDTAFFTPSPKLPTTNYHRHSGIPQRRDQLPTRNYFLCVGRLAPSKYFEHAIAACEKLELPLVIVGRGHHERALQRLAGKNTRFAGKVSREELRDYYRGARALLQPGMEDFGMATAEAQACGTPVIAYGVGGAQEVVRHLETGYLYNDQRVEALAESLRQFLDSEPPTTEALQRQAFRFSTVNFRTAIRTEVDKILGEQETKSVG